MAKRKPTTESTSTPSISPAPRKRATVRGRATADVLPITGATATTSEEVQLAVANDASSATTVPSPTEIAEAAYQRFLQRGGRHGHDVDDWIEAERELRRR